MAAEGTSLRRITEAEYAKRIADGTSRLVKSDSWAWTEREGATTLVVTYYSESEKSTLKLTIQMGSRGKTVSRFYIGNSNDVAQASRLLVSFWDMTSRRFSNLSQRNAPVLF